MTAVPSFCIEFILRRQSAWGGSIPPFANVARDTESRKARRSLGSLGWWRPWLPSPLARVMPQGRDFFFSGPMKEKGLGCKSPKTMRSAKDKHDQFVTESMEKVPNRAPMWFVQFECYTHLG